MRWQGVVFDKDGTLFDFHATWSAWAASFVHGIASDADHAARLAERMRFDLAARAFHPDSPVIAGTPGEVASLLLPLLPGVGTERLIDRINAAAVAAPQVEAAPLRPLLTRLRAAGLRLGVATNDAEAPAMAHLGRAGVAGLFDFIAGYDSGHGAKPGPGQLLAFVAATGVDPGRVVMVGDSTHDLAAGRAAGMAAVGVLTGLATRADLASAADAVLPDIGALPGWLGLDGE
jgi:phosphoglycolate phosphatase